MRLVAIIPTLLMVAAAAFGQTPSSMVVTTEWLASRLDRPDIVIVQVARDRQEYDAGHLPGARLLLLNEIAVRRDGIPNELAPVEQLRRTFERVGVGDGNRVVLYSEEANLFATRAWWTLDYLGQAENAAVLDGSIEKWRAERRPVTIDVPAVKLAKFIPRTNSAVLASLADVEKLVSSHDGQRITLLDTRPPSQFSGEEPGEEITRPGHIPGAVNLYWGDLLESADDPQLLPLPELRKKFRDAGATGGRIIVYCRSGMQSSYVYFVARFLGYNASMYDGSFFEWSNRTSNSVVKEASTK